jgi:uncharacterized membrane protein YqaE (UPF0057 family)
MKKFFKHFLLITLSIGVIIPTAMATSIHPTPVYGDPDPAVVKAALNDFRNLSKAEKKERIKEVKKAIKEYKAAKKKHMEPKASTLIQIIFAILIPPLGVYLHEGVINTRFWIDLILTILFFLPGMIYALIIVLGD